MPSAGSNKAKSGKVGRSISPGSIARGSYVVYLIIRERNLHNYSVAVLVSFWKYIGYLGFPLQMVRQYPALARLMAGRWAKEGDYRLTPLSLRERKVGIIGLGRIGKAYWLGLPGNPVSKSSRMR